jgi:hypothetical protein
LGCRRLGVLGRRPVEIVELDALPLQLLNLLPHRCMRQTTLNVRGHMRGELTLLCIVRDGHTQI